MKRAARIVVHCVGCAWEGSRVHNSVQLYPCPKCGQRISRGRAKRPRRAHIVAEFHRIEVPGNTHPLVQNFFEAMNEQRCTMPMLAARSGLGKDTVFAWRKSMPTLANFDAALNVLGLELAIRQRKEPK